MGTKDDRLALAERLAVVLKRHEMRDHVQHLRDYYRRTKRNQPHASGEWNDEHVMNVAKGLQVPPYEDVYPVKPWAWNCGCPEMSQASFNLPGRSVHRCGACGLTWIVLRPW